MKIIGFKIRTMVVAPGKVEFELWKRVTTKIFIWPCFYWPSKEWRLFHSFVSEKDAMQCMKELAEYPHVKSVEHYDSKGRVWYDDCAF